MKKIFTLLFAALTMTAAHAQVVTVDFEGDSWNALIDSPQYNGNLLYKTDYTWTDDATTLTSSLTKAWGGYYGYAEGGIAISNYIDDDITNHATYDYQLSVPKSNGSSNFAVVYCTASMSFNDGKAHTIKSMAVSPTTYELGVITNGDGYAASLAKEGTLYVVMTGYNGDIETGKVTVDLAKDGVLLNDWKTVDMSSLGAVTNVTFTMDGSDKSSYGVKAPAYFAFDNVKVDMTDPSCKCVDFEAESWNALIDSPQYNGDLLYKTDYTWTDDATTLTSSLTKAWGGYYGYAEGGIAISNYIDDDITNHATYDYQLSVPKSNGSSNFAVVYCTASMSFNDGKAHTIKSMAVSPTTYELGVITNGDGYAASLAKEGTLYVVMTGYNGDTETGKVTVDLAKDGTLLTDWKTVDMSSLGAVTNVTFTMDGSDKSSYGVKAPAYFAFDNVVVDMTDTTSAINTTRMSSNAAVVAYYTMDGKRLSTPQKGINIIRMADGTSKKVIIR